MPRLLPSLLILLLALGAMGCTTDAVKRSAYEAAYQKSCMDRTGVPDCDPEHHSYDDYQKARGELLKPGPGE
jgi:hypothetical protein